MGRQRRVQKYRRVQATTGLLSALFDECQSPLDVLWMDAKENDPVGQFPDQLAVSRALDGQVTRQWPFESYRTHANTLPLHLFTRCVALMSWAARRSSWIVTGFMDLP